MSEEEKPKKKRRLAGNHLRGDRRGIEENAADYYKEYQDREVQVQDVFLQSMKIAQELQSRIEREMFSGMQYKGKDDPSMSLFNPALNKSAEGLGKLVAQLQGIHLRLLKEGEKQARNMSREAKVEQAVRFIKKLPAAEKARIKKELGWG
jgi:hypothetical protein